MFILSITGYSRTTPKPLTREKNNRKNKTANGLGFPSAILKLTLALSEPLSPTYTNNPTAIPMTLETETEGLRIARERIAQEAEQRSGFLDLGMLGLRALPEELFSLRHLRGVNLGYGYIDQIDGEWQDASGIDSDNILENSLTGIGALVELENLSLCGIAIHDLSALSGLAALQTLHCSDTAVSDLSVLSGLAALQTLHCSGTAVGDLSALSGLAALQTLHCSRTAVSDLSVLSGLAALQTLYCSGTAVSDLSALSGLAALQSLDCSRTEVSDLSALSCLAALKTLDCYNTAVSDLSALSGLTALQTLGCSGTAVSDLSALSGLAALQSLHCYNTAVSDLSALSGLAALQTLHCSGTTVSDLSALSGLAALQSLDCSRTAVSDLSVLSGLAALQSLHCYNTAVSDLSALSGLAALQSLDCSGTEVSDLSALSGLAALQSLDCSRTAVSDLSALSGLVNLQRLNCSDCKLTNISPDFWVKSSLQWLYLYQTELPNIPAEALSQSSYSDCLPSLRAHLNDLEAGSEAIPDVKLMILGNGRVGKTQICRRLRGEAYDSTISSTHGIRLATADLPPTDTYEAANLAIWDFGGQDIYHGTHALFLKTRAIFLLVWIPASDGAASHDCDGLVFRNHPLSYWLAYVRHLGGADSPVLIVQTRCDRIEDEARRLPIEDSELEGLGFVKSLHYSALKDRGRAALDEALGEAVVWLRERQGTALIGAGRLRLQRRLEALRAADAVAAEQRQYRTLSQAHFRQLCEEVGGISAPEHCLSYLHNAGVVFYRPGLFGEQIILDQAWALEAIYTVFQRGSCYRELQRLRGRFSRTLLALLVWRDYSDAEQRLFLDMMQSCGICFVHKHGDRQLGTEDEYIAPELLPDKAAVASELAEKWSAQADMVTALYRYQLHQPGLLRSLMAEIGQQAGVNGIYWQNGVCVYEQTTRSHALIEQEEVGTWQGVLRISCQGGQAGQLLAQLRERITQQNHHWGLEPIAEPAEVASRAQPEPVNAPPLAFVQPPKAGITYCVSYAWGDDTPEGKPREAVVNQLCHAAEARGIHILRDKGDLKFGDQLSAFMGRIAQGDRVFVILSDKYLKSANCMYELFEIWRTSRHDNAEALQRVRLFSTDCARIFSALDRVNYAIYWRQQHNALQAVISEHGAAVLGETDFRQFKLMDDFARHIGDILAACADTIHARKFEDLIAYGFDDPHDE
ncbi:leucine-rich repeat domain-containing protein [Methylovulum psychrotolerans]|uniref:GTP-binding protein n=1 Tax=Methylovulum psychrotolerans TaxID=1704499 RepID=A0A2S5CNP5_9GAMM|nr:leucine-rich repeat domain-containing protein [Methylovulum psychrotolerans]POZ52408.1 GTP-binding protein [Methylovulum psychrotolerans]